VANGWHVVSSRFAEKETTGKMAFGGNAGTSPEVRLRHGQLVDVFWRCQKVMSSKRTSDLFFCLAKMR